MQPFNLTLLPRLSEKTYGLSKGNVYVFKVPKLANKHEIAEAVAKQYDVTVEEVNTAIAKGKVKTSIRKGRPIEGRKADIKKAYVTLAEGNVIKMFEEEQ